MLYRVKWTSNHSTFGFSMDQNHHAGQVLIYLTTRFGEISSRYRLYFSIPWTFFLLLTRALTADTSGSSSRSLVQPLRLTDCNISSTAPIVGDIPCNYARVAVTNFSSAGSFFSHASVSQVVTSFPRRTSRRFLPSPHNKYCTHLHPTPPKISSQLLPQQQDMYVGMLTAFRMQQVYPHTSVASPSASYDV
ncbi:hypothetical protein PILCRDRAFT_233966 [Piloderma croceum F 1598]|uniref:Uncharacterized protein n=1 Tax=Piloderma croceum (strain F 1598) TaxID=765440 RepID=A0A0C3CFZ7_PILCF|nr:hypothetical protein PILCRDRAFT_233966 [Piloderma croceum F 1598]